MKTRFTEIRTGRHAASPRLAWALTKIEIRRNAPAATPRIMTPDAVDLPLPRPCHEQMQVPASINGADLSLRRP